jgi:hypothetical membrane protein
LLLAGGLTVQAAFLIQRRAVGRAHAHTKWRMTTQGAASGLILLAGIALVTIGYYAAHHGWWPISTATTLPIAAAIIASILNRRAASDPSCRPTRLAGQAGPRPEGRRPHVRRHPSPEDPAEQGFRWS